MLISSASWPDAELKGLDCLLEASRQILLEAIEKQSHIDLPRTLDSSKKYSWRQRKEEPVRYRQQQSFRDKRKMCLLGKCDAFIWSLQLFGKMSLDVLDAVEVEYRVHLSELQKTYKEKQRDLSKLQRRRDKR